MDVFTITGRGYDSNIFVILGAVPTVIDAGTGLNKDYVHTTLERFIDPSLIQQVLLTHEHFDHVGGIKELVALADSTVSVVAHPSTAEKLHSGESAFAEMLGAQMPRFEVDYLVKDKDIVKIGDEGMMVLETPGHSKGSICVFNPKDKVLFSGDTIFAHGDFGRYDLPGGDYQLLRLSIERLDSLDICCLYPGHGPIVENSAAHHVEKALFNITAYV